MKNNNFLILAAGTRNKVVQYFMKEFKGVGTVIATDASIFAPAIYDADKYYIVPAITESGYIDVILEICIVNEIGFCTLDRYRKLVVNVTQSI